MNIYTLSILSTMLMFLATTFGSAFVFMIPKVNDKIERICLGLASGIMIAASIFSLLIPALDSTSHCLPIVISILAGGFILWLLDFFLSSKEKKRSFFFFAVTIHNIPEGMIVGLACALAYQQSSLSLASVLALATGIAIQNIPEGMAVSFTFLEEGKTKWKAFFYGVLSGIVEPIFGILMVLLSHVLEPFMPFFLSLAAGTMFYVVVDELIPKSKDSNSAGGAVSFMLGFVIMMYLDVILG